MTISYRTEFLSIIFEHATSKKQAKTPATGKQNFTITQQFSIFHDIFKLVQRAFHDGIITFLEIMFVPNQLDNVKWDAY